MARWAGFCFRPCAGLGCFLLLVLMAQLHRWPLAVLFRLFSATLHTLELDHVLNVLARHFFFVFVVGSRWGLKGEGGCSRDLPLVFRQFLELAAMPVPTIILARFFASYSCTQPASSRLCRIMRSLAEAQCTLRDRIHFEACSNPYRACQRICNLIVSECNCRFAVSICLGFCTSSFIR